MKIFVRFELVSVTKAGDYYQILFHDGLDTDNEPYFMIQKQFEVPDGDVCYFESHNKKLIEHCKARSASLSTNRLSLVYGEDQRRDVEIEFGLHSTDFQDLGSTLKEMIPRIRIDV